MGISYRVMVRALLIASICALGAGGAAADQGGGLEVTITNLTRAQVISPPVVVVHRKDFRVFAPGDESSEGLAALAENGVPDGLVAELEGEYAVKEVAVAGGPIMPGSSVTVRLGSRSARAQVSVLGMLVTTNDAFFAAQGLDLWWRSTSTDAQVYDAGSEANTESCAHIPGPPCGNPFVSPDEEGEGFIHIHNGVHGVGDLEPQTSDWRGPGARITIRRVR